MAKLSDNTTLRLFGGTHLRVGGIIGKVSSNMTVGMSRASARLGGSTASSVRPFGKVDRGWRPRISTSRRTSALAGRLSVVVRHIPGCGHERKAEFAGPCPAAHTSRVPPRPAPGADLHAAPGRVLNHVCLVVTIHHCATIQCGRRSTARRLDPSVLQSRSLRAGAITIGAVRPEMHVRRTRSRQWGTVGGHSTCADYRRYRPGRRLPHRVAAR